MKTRKLEILKSDKKGYLSLSTPGEGGTVICNLELDGIYKADEMREVVRRYNAHEKLLAALKALVEYEDDAPPEGSKGAEVYAQARAAIAKATT